MRKLPDNDDPQAEPDSKREADGDRSRLSQASPTSEYRLHDFRQRWRRLSERQLQNLEAILRRWARAAANRACEFIEERVEMRLLGLKQRPYGQLLATLQSPTSLHVIEAPPATSPFLLELPVNLVLPMIARLLGGQTETRDEPSRPLTRVETAVLAWVVEYWLEDLRTSWQSCRGLRFALAEHKSDPAEVQIVAADENTLLVGFELTVAHRSSRLHFCFPIEPFSPIFSALTRPLYTHQRAPLEDEPGESGLLQRVQNSRVTVTAELEPIRVRLADVLSLRPGDIIDTEIATEQPVVIHVEGRPTFLARAADREGRRAIRLTDRITRAD